MSPATEPSRQCARCGAALKAWTSASVCWRCMMQSSAGAQNAAGGSGAVAESSTAAGLRFGDYLLEQEIAHGGMGVVYRARQLSLGRTVAVKLLLLGRYASAESVERFRREAQSAAALRHPNIVAIHEIGEHEGQQFFSMDYVEGQSLAEAVRAGPLEPRLSAEVVGAIAQAIHYAHEQGVLHRDLKPSNVLLDPFGQVRITDFGLAKRLDGSSDLTVTGQVVGTPNYLSPEQAAGKQAALGPASDVYSIGALMYELLTGRPPFLSNSLQETLSRIQNNEPVSPRVLNPARHRDLETICLKCLQKEPERRYGSAQALAEDLGRWLRHEPILARPIGTIGRLKKWTRRSPRRAMLVLVTSLAVIGFFVGQTISGVRLRRADSKVRAANASLSQSLNEMRWRQVDDAMRADKTGEAMAQLSRFLRENPNDGTAAARLLSTLSSCNFPVLLVPPLVHESPVVALDFSRAGDRLATASSGGIARLWNAESGKLEVELAHPAPLMNCLLCGENDHHLLTLSTELKVRLWDLGSRRLLSEVELGPSNDPRTPRIAEMTRDRRRVAMNVRSNVVEILDTETGIWLQPGLVVPTEISRFAISADGQLLAASSASELRLFKFGSGQPLFQPVELHNPPEEICFSDDGRWLACSCRKQASWMSNNAGVKESESDAYKVWVMNTSTGLKQPEFPAAAFHVVFLGRTDRLITIPGAPEAPMSLVDPHTGRNCGSPYGQPDFDAQWHGNLLFSCRDVGGHYPSTVRLLDPATGHAQTEPFVHDAPFSGAQLRSDGRVVATASQDRTVRLWSTQMRQAEPMTLARVHTAWEAQWSPSGERIMYTCLAGNRPEIGFSNGRTGAADAPPAELEGAEFAHFAQWSPDGTRVAAAVDHWAGIWDARDARPLSRPLRHDGHGLTYCVFSPNGELLATAGNDNAVRLWDGHTGEALSPPLIHSQNPLKISFTSDGGRLATACVDGTIRIWSVPEGKLVLGPLHHSGICWVAAFSPDDRWLVSASSDSTAQLWDARTGQPVLPPFRHEGPVFWASFSPDGRAIATCTEFGTARVWDTATGQLLAGPMNHPGKVWYVKWSQDGRFLATTCTDGAARVSDARTGHLAAQPFRHGDELQRAEFSPDGQRLLTAASDGAVKVWDLSFLRPPLPVPGWVPLLAESLGGKRIGPKDSLEAVPGDSFQLATTHIEQWGTNDYYGRWAHWLLHERFERPVKPFRP
jgi:eukaryotic-like serine/threonine-protein kinase